METDLPNMPRLTPARLISVLLLVGMLLAIPVGVVILGQRTRTQIQADVACTTPPIPRPAECVGGEWKLYTTEDNCIRFRCEPTQ